MPPPGREAALEIPVGPLVATYDKLSGSIHAREAELDKALANTKAKVRIGPIGFTTQPKDQINSWAISLRIGDTGQ